MKESPLEEIVHQGWHVLSGLLHLHQSERENITNDDSAPEHGMPLIFQDKVLKNPDEVKELYGSCLFASYLDGCSVVLNHGDLVSPWIAALCQDLQRSFPHAYANCYLTPPSSQAVQPHADDRDVLVLQLVGEKDWKVYQSIPVPFPYPHEQVGKEGICVPQQVLDGPLSLSTTLRPGDVLYMPRGFVHEARCSDSLSFHVTIALATHDWSLAGAISTAAQTLLTQVVEFRKSILPVTDPKAVQAHLNTAMKMLHEKVTAESVLNNVYSKMEQHNRRSFSPRMKLIQSARFPSPTNNINSRDVVGLKAANCLTFTSIIRAATQDERARIQIIQSRPRGLNVREETADVIMSIIAKLKSDPTIQCGIINLRSLSPAPNPLVCDLTLLSFAKRAVELGAVAVVSI